MAQHLLSGTLHCVGVGVLCLCTIGAEGVVFCASHIDV